MNLIVSADTILNRLLIRGSFQRASFKRNREWTPYFLKTYLKPKCVHLSRYDNDISYNVYT